MSPQKVKKWLQAQPTYTLHKSVKRKFPTRAYKTSGIDEQWQADLVDMQAHKRVNNGYAHILTAIDIFSRFAFAEPIKSKKDVQSALDAIFKRSGGRKPRLLQTDQGTEFENRSIRKFYKSHGIHQFSVKSAYKAAIVERFHRTLRGRMFRYFTKNGTHKWIDVLQDLVNAYNSTKHRALGNNLAPDMIKKEYNESAIWQSRNIITKPTGGSNRLKLNDVVRLAKVKKVFDRGYTPNWTEELFTIYAIDKSQSPIMYRVRDSQGVFIEGKFYKSELQKVDNVVRIEKVLKTVGKKAYVKWVGFVKPTWIWRKDII